MKANSRVLFCVVGLFALALVGLWRFDNALGQQGVGGGSGGFGGGAFAGGGFGPTGSIAANTQYVYVLQDNILIQLSAKDLTELKRVTLLPASIPAGEVGEKAAQRGARVRGGQGGAGGGFGGGQGGAGGGIGGGQGGAGGGFGGGQGGAGGGFGGGQGGAGGGIGGGQGGAGGGSGPGQNGSGN